MEEMEEPPTSYQDNDFELIKPVTIEIEPPVFNRVNHDFYIQKDNPANQDSMALESIEPITIEIEPSEFDKQIPSITFPKPESNASYELEPIVPIDLIEPIVIDTDTSVFAHLAELLKDDNHSDEVEYTNLTEIFSEQQIRKNRRNNKSDNTKKQKSVVIRSEKPRSIFTIVSDILFYSAILLVLMSALLSGQKDGEPRMFMGFSYFIVLTPSMQSEIPKGSFILVHQTNSQELKIGDNITFMRDANTSITHKIVDIYENYENSGARGFQTKGVNNAAPDSDIVYEANVVGKVIFHIPGVGAVISSLKANIYIVFIIFGLCVILSFLLRGLFAKPTKPANKNTPANV